jgi:hypothetical protein
VPAASRLKDVGMVPDTPIIPPYTGGHMTFAHFCHVDNEEM